MKVEIIKKTKLQEIPSASGIEIVNGLIYIIVDDSPFLYCLNHNLEIIQKVVLFDTNDFSSGRIPKSLKPDLECMTALEINNNDHLLIIGSGSSENRETGFLIKLPTKYNKNHIVNKVPLTNLFNLLKSNDDIGSLNLEGAAAIDKNIILFNRSNGNAPNTALIFNKEEFIVFLTENVELIPFPEVLTYVLPSIDGIQAGFSGASGFNDLLFFTASVENTSNAVEDGIISGSFVGTIKVNTSNSLKDKQQSSIAMHYTAALVEENEETFVAKVESISIYEQENDKQYIALAVTDDDLGGSQLLMLDIKIE